jgi:hypothetical protein
LLLMARSISCSILRIVSFLFAMEQLPQWQ